MRDSEVVYTQVLFKEEYQREQSPDIEPLDQICRDYGGYRLIESVDRTPGEDQGRINWADTIHRIENTYKIADLCDVINCADDNFRSTEVIFSGERTEAELRDLEIVRDFVELYGSPYDEQLDVRRKVRKKANK